MSALTGAGAAAGALLAISAFLALVWRQLVRPGWRSMRELIGELRDVLGSLDRVPTLAGNLDTLDSEVDELTGTVRKLGEAFERVDWDSRTGEGAIRAIAERLKADVDASWEAVRELDARVEALADRVSDAALALEPPEALVEHREALRATST